MMPWIWIKSGGVGGIMLLKAVKVGGKRFCALCGRPLRQKYVALCWRCRRRAERRDRNLKDLRRVVRRALKDNLV